MFQFTGFMRNPGINARLTATPGLSQPSTSQLLAPRHPPYALICLTTLTHHSEQALPSKERRPLKATSKNATTDADDITTPVELISYYSVCCQIVKDQTPEHPEAKTDCKSKFAACNTLRQPQPEGRVRRGGILSTPNKKVN